MDFRQFSGVASGALFVEGKVLHGEMESLGTRAAVPDRACTPEPVSAWPVTQPSCAAGLALTFVP
jgi:hypothetical protein